jgi:hypothetical protein
MKIKCPECQTTLRRDGQAYRCPACSFRLEIQASLISELKGRLRTLKQSLGGLSLDELRRIVKDREHPATSMLVSFAAWGVAYFLRWPIFLAVVFGLSVLLGPWGLVMMVVLPLVYRAHKEAIHRQAENLTRERDGPPEP